MKKAYLSERAPLPLREYITDLGISLEFVKESPGVYPAISSHPDIFLCIIAGNPVHSQKDLGYAYPENIRYNGVQIGSYFIHNLKHTAPSLLEAVAKAGLIPVHVNQGYTRCSLLPLDDGSAITSDHGIATALSGTSLDILFIRPGHIHLCGFPWGFIGGTGGSTGSTVIFNGNLHLHPDSKSIYKFIQDRGLQVKDFPQYPLTDIGSILFEEGKE